jgi:hypothetical protein
MGKKITISSIPMGTNEHGEELKKYSVNGVYPIAGVRVRPGEVFEFGPGQDKEAEAFVEGHRGRVVFVDGRTKADITAESWEAEQTRKHEEAKELYRAQHPPSPMEQNAVNQQAQIQMLSDAVSKLTDLVSAKA